MAHEVILVSMQNAFSGHPSLVAKGGKLALKQEYC